MALKLMNGIPGNLRIDSLPERFHCNIIGYPFHPVDTLSCLLGCILIPKVGTNPESVTTPSFAATAMSLAEVIVGSQLSSRRTSSRMELSVLACVVVAIIRLSKFHRGRSVCELTARKQNKVSEQGKLSTELD